MTGRLHLARGEVHSWCVPLDVRHETSAALSAVLTAEERSRSDRFRFERHRRRFIVAHAVLRDLLGRYLGTHPEEIRFVHNAFGKPALSPEFGGRLKFNLSHSAGLALMAIASADVGVDLEHIRARPEYAEIAERFFSAAEVDYLNGLPSHLHAEGFLSCWTRKEACVKACGEGLAMPTDPAPAGLHGAWSVSTLHPAPGYIGALAVAGRGWRLNTGFATFANLAIDTGRTADDIRGSAPLASSATRTARSPRTGCPSPS